MIRRRGGSFRVIVYAGKDLLTGRDLKLRESITDEREVERILRRLVAQVDAESHAETNASFRVTMESGLRTHEVEQTTRAGYEQYARNTSTPRSATSPSAGSRRGCWRSSASSCADAERAATAAPSSSTASTVRMSAAS